MVYATCSILPSENTLQTKNFIEKNPEYELIGEEKNYAQPGLRWFLYGTDSEKELKTNQNIMKSIFQKG